MGDIYIPLRYRVRFNANLILGQPVQAEVKLIPTGVFGVQDGRTLLVRFFKNLCEIRVSSVRAEVRKAFLIL